MLSLRDVQIAPAFVYAPAKGETATLTQVRASVWGAQYASNTYFNTPALRIGLKLCIYQDGILLNTLNPLPVKRWADWDLMAETNLRKSGERAQTEGTFCLDTAKTYGGLTLSGKLNQSIALIVQDSLKELQGHQMSVHGTIERTTA
jgi:hypothetical protein